MSEQFVHAHVMGADPGALLPLLQGAGLPVPVRLARAAGGSSLLFEGIDAAIGTFLAGLPWAAWVETDDSVASARRLSLLRGGEVLYEEAVDPDGNVHVRHGRDHRSGPSSPVPLELVTHARAAIAALSEAGIRLLPVRRVWEGDPFPDLLAAEVVAVIPGDRPAGDVGEIPL
jgi:hypothetical protein